ncbi:E3 ubiquitin-protein ligase BIG BROTHER-like [Euphorbia lathyris]|uniref:E3 ubiquitin-protein ligase BIG BROTHER-like n=1 Tax=Euphorbia lathyris TaxID=212925 RepID=UPI0033134A0E
MSWNPHMDVNYSNDSYPYNSAGSFIEYFEGLTYEHVNFIFDGASHVQESVYASTSANLHKFGISQPGSSVYYDHSHAYEVHNHGPVIDDYRRPPENPSTMTSAPTSVINEEWEGSEDIRTHNNPVECPRRHHNAQDFQVMWQDNVDPDNMSYEELLELGEAVGTQSRGLSQELISMLPVSKYKCSLFKRKSRCERCVICQMEYKRGDRRMTLPCKHAYHVGCGTRWLTINKACPICYMDVFGDSSKNVRK